MEKFKTGLIIFSESRSREDVYKQRKPIQDREVNKFINEFDETLDFMIPLKDGIRCKSDIKKAVGEINASDVLCAILYIPIFISPAMVAHVARQLIKPVILMGNPANDSMSQLGTLAAGGAIEQIGIRCKRIPGEACDNEVKDELLKYIKVLYVDKMLSGSTYGCIGGRSLGISTGASDPVLWEKIFGIDTEHIDQFEIVKRAESIPDQRVRKYSEWIKAFYGAIFYKEGRFDDARLDKMIKSYLATKSIIDDYELDFIGIKCQPEMSNGYVLQCLNVQLLNDPYDADGMKEPFVCSCEADSDGALTAQILKIISGGEPTALQDIAHVDDKKMVLANCGSMASYFAMLSKTAKENLKDVHLQPHVFGTAGGASTQFVCAADTFTYARLFRKDGRYHMSVILGKTIKEPREKLFEYSWYRPTSFVEIDINGKDFLREFCSNHFHCVRGDHVNEIKAYCDYKGIAFKYYNKESNNDN